ncbi:MAG: Gfo/Idh/MocA family oxidoreductase, partial [Chloroflexota bacterium]|nr:Gfo/Idh/MocA family oxidoreductase [Chloroflexota bacterium]
MARLRIGVIGCGAIAQIQHLPHLRELDTEFEIGGLCDVSAQLLEAIGDDYRVPTERRFLDYHDLVRSDIDAVIVCPSGSHAPPSIAAAEAGKHVLVEKPMCTTPREAEAIVAAADRHGVVLMVAYMKRYEPAYQFAQARVRDMTDVRFIQVNHLHPDNALHTAEFKVRRFDDVPGDLVQAARVQEQALLAEALDDPQPTEAMARAYNLILGSMIHDIGNLHGLFGPPARVLSAEIWREEHRRLIASALGYADPAALPDDIAAAYNIILGSMIHDIGNLHGLF